MRGNKILLFTVCIGSLTLSMLRAQQSDEASRSPPASETVASRHVRGNIYQLNGGFGNAFFYVGPDEVVVIDAKFNAETAGRMLAEIKKVTEKPVRHVVLTHSDGYDVTGLRGFPPNLMIICHVNARQDIAQSNAAAATERLLPNVTFSKDLTLFLRGAEIRLHHYGPAHTNGDIAIYIAGEKVAFVGDLVAVGRDPVIHANKQGFSFGLVAALKELVRLDADLFLSGHADGTDKKGIESAIARIEQKRAKVKSLVQEGKTLEEVKAAFAGAEQQAMSAGRRWPSLEEIVYRELKQNVDRRP